jgi:TPP-dependent pyruvate/acetoin dehydrogenase alpha subunit
MSALTENLTPLADHDLALLLRIRHFERTLLDLFALGRLNGTTHTCLGQEYVPVSLRPLLTDEDFLFSNHRGHGHYLTRFDDLAGLLAEIMGREGAICHGVGGSQHIYRRGYLSTGVQGESLPVAAGVALHLKRTAPGALALAYIGDGTWGQGAVYEALNLASLWRLPLVVVVENNQIAQSTPTRLQMAGTIAARAGAFDVAYVHVTSVDVNAIRVQLGPCIQAVRREGRPLVIEFATTRLGPHSKGDDTRSAAEIEALERGDWYRRYREQFAAQVARIEPEAAAQVAQVAADVSARSLSHWETPWAQASE